MFSLPLLPPYFTIRRATRHLAGRCLLLAGLLAGPGAHAQDSTFTRLVQPHHFAFAPQPGGQFAGPGWDKLRQDIAHSQLVLVGEMHGTAQIPQFAAAVAQVLQPKLFVTEIDYNQAQDLTTLADQPGPPTAYAQQHPMGLSFFSLEPEFALARQLRTQRATILGIDQVNFFATGRFYTKLAALTKSAAARAYFTRYAATSQAHDNQVMHQGSDLSQLTMQRQSAGALDSLVALTSHDGPAVRRLVQDYVASAHIYQNHNSSHAQRVNLMKSSLLRQLRPYQPTAETPLPKVLFKFGAVHAGRDLSALSVFDVGNLAVNLADAQSQQSLHLLVLGQQGTYTVGASRDNQAKNAAAYEDLDSFAVFGRRPDPAAWSAVDLRPVRRALLRHQVQITDPELEAYVRGYDYLIIIPKTTGSLIH